MVWRKHIRTIIAGFSALLLWNCGGGSTGTLSVGLTDASTDQYQAVYVTVREVQVHKSGDGEDSWRTLSEPGKTYDLLTLVNGVREELGLADLETGHYTQMRLVLGTEPEDADGSINILSRAHPYANYVIDLEGNERELTVPSGMRTGVKIVQGFDINENETTELVLDFDAAASVVVAGASGRYQLKPTIRILELADASIISGAVSSGEEAVEGATVSAQVFDAGAADAKDRVTVEAATVTDAEGGYSLFLSPGAYNLVVSKEGFATSAVKVTVAAGETAAQDVSLETASTGTLTGTATTGGDEDAYVTVSIRRAVTIDEADEEIEITSRNVANGGAHSAVLEEGDFIVVGSSFGETTVSETATVAADAETVLDLSL